MGVETRIKTNHASRPPVTRAREIMDFIGYCGRVIGTATSFAVFGVGSLFLGVIVLPLISMLIRDQDRRSRRSRAVVGSAMKGFTWFMSGVGVLRYEISGFENVKKGKNYLILANHPSLIDVVFLLSIFPTADCVIKEPLRKNFFTRHLMIGVDYISNEDPIEWLQKCVERLEDGRSLILFPEGTRTAAGKPLCFKAGAGSVAVRAGTECLPVIIRCEPTTLTKSESWYHVPDRRVFFSMQIQPPISPRDVVTDSDDERQAGRAFNQYLHEYFTRTLVDRSAAGQPPVPDALG
jgi:1-acyl-sn-glycerol-3-phosphate acyltransferase